MGAVTLVLLDCCVQVRDGQCREDGGQLDTELAVQQVEESWVEASQVVVEGIDEHLERQVAFELGGGACEHEMSADAGTSREFAEEPGLADAGFAHQLDDLPLPAREVDQCAVEECEFLGATD